MAGRAATVLAPLVSEIALVRIRVGEVPGRRVVDHGLGDLAEGGHQAMDQQENEEEAHGSADATCAPSGMQDARRSGFIDGA